MSESIINHFGDGEKYDCQIEYIVENLPSGTAGALRQIPDDVDGPLIIMNGDIITNLDFSDLISYHNKMKWDVTICAKEFSIQIPYGVIEFSKGALEKIEEKPIISRNINCGIYVVNSSIFRNLDSSKEKIDMPDLISDAVEKNMSVGVFPITEYWIDIGRAEDLENARLKFPNFVSDN